MLERLRQLSFERILLCHRQSTISEENTTQIIEETMMENLKSHESWGVVPHFIVDNVFEMHEAKISILTSYLVVSK